MTIVLTLVVHGPTLATRNAAFSGDEPLLPGPPAGQSLLSRGRKALSSPARACLETAARLGVAPKTDSALANLDCGRWTGLALAQVAETEPEALVQWIDDPTWRGHGGESRSDLVLRVADWLQGLSQDGTHCLAFTHSPVIRALVLHILEAPAPAFWSLDIGPWTITEFRHDGRRWTLRALACPLSSNQPFRARRVSAPPTAS
ncbi:broad specificity phosphatase PhoE [Gemmobacter caeni]|uniref:Broad specificity phosphatase PhoE n=1 Tax=Gemmobacter caeni TaxID=589035 RepID=A0A2T6AG95_9RHOB|nr:histidine phosphatase family protein [Gemmobacter caeni]PTX42816.1 broad specificity phosphatase PhoE [Gemmobacter caeni]TWI92458.1 broad specificity phosphatase PhoE [Gemmobacter caeni]